MEENKSDSVQMSPILNDSSIVEITHQINSTEISDNMDNKIEQEVKITTEQINNINNKSPGFLSLSYDDGSSCASSSNSSFEITEIKTSNNKLNNKNANNKNSKVMLNTTSSSLCNLLVYTSGESDSEADSDDSDSYDCESDVPEVVENPVIEVPKKKKKKNPSLLDTLKTLGELSIDDLPPVPDISRLSLHVREEDCDEIGKISSIIDRLVMVESIPNKPAYDIDTLLFLDNGKQPLGYIFDVIGAVTCPMYAIRFNSTQEIAALNITKGLPVFSAPKSEHSQYVFVQQLLKEKGTDASWKNDFETPIEEQDLSDDEVEGIRRSGINPDNRKRNSIEHHRSFEKDMNVKNIIDSRLHAIRDNLEPTTKKHTPNNNYKRGYQFQPGYRPSYGFSQNNLPSASCAFPPPFSMPFMAALPPFAPPNMAAFIPSMPPPNFIPRLPPPSHPNLSIYPPMQPAYPHDMVFPPLPPMPNTSQAKTPQHMQNMMFPPDMGLPRPPSQHPGFVPNMPFFDPRMPMYFPANAPQLNTRQPIPKPRHYFQKRQ